MAMIKCPECGKDISNQSDKCIYCGFPIRNEDMIVCSNCGVLNQAGSTFCSSCGNPLVKGITAPSTTNHAWFQTEAVHCCTLYRHPLR